jgi:hypothetical protein
MPSNLFIHAYVALAALAPASTVSGNTHPAHVAHAPKPAHHVARGGRANDGQVTLSLA